MLSVGTALPRGGVPLHCTVVLVSRSYSTCSFNPLENEAVVCAALTTMRGEVQLEAPPREWWTQRGLQTRWVCPWLAPSA